MEFVVIITGGTISYCYNIGDINGGESIDVGIGGIAGRTSYGNIENCYNIGNITAIGNITVSGSLGGIIGGYYECTVLNCKSKCKINKTEAFSYVGGIIGKLIQEGTISNCEWYSEGLEYGIGTINSNENATKNASIVMPSIDSVINQE